MIACLLFTLFFQTTPVQTTNPTTDQDRLRSYDVRLEREQKALFESLPLRSIGPRAMGGRVVAIQGFSDAPQTFIAAYASGGLWRTENMGTIWEPLFDDMPSITIGNIAIDPNDKKRIWVGTGEDNSSRSSYAGTGIYLTEDGGKTWHHKGLLNTHHISTIVLHPKNPNVVYVSVIGKLYTTNPERGVYKTTDGGTTWEKILFINDDTGVIDLAMDPQNPDRLYAAAWQRSRKAWNFVESGPGSGLYITDNGGTNWKKVTNDLPQGDDVGRIGLSICLSHPQTIYATVDFQGEAPEEKPDRRPLTKRKLAKMDKETFLKLKDKDIRNFLRGNSFHKDITVKKVRKQLKKDEITLQDLLDYVYDGNAALFDRPIHGAQVFRSDDSGKTWRKTHDKPLPNVVYSYGYYFGQVNVDPQNPDVLYVSGVPFIKSTDGGKTFQNSASPGVHVDHQALWINPSNSKHLILGNDGGIYMSWDSGANWQDFNHQAVGQFYTVAYDMAKPYNVYGGLQDNGVWGGPSYKQDRYHSPWQRISGGDGAFVQVDPTDNRTIYTGYQFGHYARRDLLGAKRTLNIFPRHALKEQPYRFNWMTPFVLSQHQNNITYMGGNRVLRSLDKGENWEPISPDLTTNPKQDGDVTYGTITALRESPHSFGTLYVGTDDGKLWVSRGDYDQWQDISHGVQAGLWVSSIEISPHEKGEVFITLTGYRNDDFRAYLYHSADYGKTWNAINGDLPDEPCNVIRQDIENPDILYLGTDVGLWVSFDKGKTWHPYQYELPKVPVYALEIHPREHELIVATHGRSIFILEAHHLSQLTPENMNQELFVLDLEQDSVKFAEYWGNDPWPWSTRPQERPHSKVWFYTKDSGDVSLEIVLDKHTVFKTSKQVTPGLHNFKWDYEVTSVAKKSKKKKDKKTAMQPHDGENGKKYAKAGSYTLKLTKNGVTEEKTFKIKD